MYVVEWNQISNEIKIESIYYNVAMEKTGPMIYTSVFFINTRI